MILDEFAEAGIFAFANRPVETDRLTTDVQDAPGFFKADAGSSGGFLCCRLSAHFVQEALCRIPQSAQNIDHVDRNADRSRLVGNRPRDRLANPPGGVGRELEAAAVLVFVDRPHQARIAFLNQIQEAETPIAVFLGDRDDQPQVAAGELPFGVFVFAVLLAEYRTAAAEARRAFLSVGRHQIAAALAARGPLRSCLPPLPLSVREADSAGSPSAETSLQADPSAAGRGGFAG